MKLIDADALKEVLQRYHNLYHAQCGNLIGQGLQRAIKSCIDLLDNAPTIDPESLRPQGTWIMRGGKRYCSHCNERACVTRDTDDFWYTVGTAFCPNCGAKMKGAGDDAGKM